MRFLSASFSLAIALAVAPSVQAQGPAPEDADPAAAATARAHYNGGMKAFGEQRYAEAALEFEAAAASKPSPIALYTAALSWDRTNAPDRAADDYARALAIPGLTADKAQPAKERLASLDAMLGQLAVSGPEGTRVQLDANTERPAPANLHGVAGVHTLSVLKPDGTIERRPVVLERGKTKSLDLATAPPPPSTEPPPQAAPPPAPAPVPTEAPAPPPPAPHVELRRTLGFTAVGVGGASLLAGIVLGLEALDARDAYNAAPTQAGFDHASSLQTWTDVAFIAGGVFVAGGVALVLWPSPKGAAAPSAALAPTSNGVVLKGTF